MYKFLVLIALIFPALSSANEPLQKVGVGSLSVAFWDVYDATLFAPQAKFNPQKTFALELRYKLDLDGKDIAERSIDEMREQGWADENQLKKWLAQMEKIFPNIKEGDVLRGEKTAAGNAVFLHNGSRVGEVKDAEFVRAFFDIWLSEKTSEPDLRLALLGRK